MILINNIYNNKYTTTISDVNRIIVKNNNLSDKAKLMYLFLLSFNSGSLVSNEFIREELNIGKRTFYKKRKELQDTGLLKIETIGRNRFLFIGLVTETGFIDFSTKWRFTNDN